MEAEQRKEKFIEVLSELLQESDGIKVKLAQKLDIKPSTLTRWFQGKIDPASIDLGKFIQVAELSETSTDELAKVLGISNRSKVGILNKFKILIRDLLSHQSLEQLGNKLGVSYGAISGWISLQRNVDPRRIPINTIATLAEEKGWTIEQLLAYLGLKQIENIKQDTLTKIQSSVLELPLIERVKLLTWLSSDFEQQLHSLDLQNLNNQPDKEFSDSKQILIILEDENLLLTSRYSSNLAIHLQLQPDEIQVASIQNLPESLKEFDLLIFDISTADSPSIALIQEISFNGDIVVFSSEDLPDNVRAGLEDRVTDLLVKPIDWSNLKDKEYFG